MLGQTVSHLLNWRLTISLAPSLLHLHTPAFRFRPLFERDPIISTTITTNPKSQFQLGLSDWMLMVSFHQMPTM